jgi:hypothetical protein
MTRKLLLATATPALMTGSALAQTINNAPQNSPAGVSNEVKQVSRTGDSSQVGGAPSANTKVVAESAARSAAFRTDAGSTSDRTRETVTNGTITDAPPSVVAQQHPRGERQFRNTGTSRIDRDALELTMAKLVVVTWDGK